MSPPKSTNLSSYAAERKRDLILSKVLEPLTFNLFKKFKFKKGMHGLDLGCRTGEVTLQLKSIFEEGKMTGVGFNDLHINIAREVAASKNQMNVEFIKKNISEWSGKGNYDFVYSRLLFNQLQEPLNVLKMLYRSLKKGGFIIAEEMNLSNFHCFPSCYAFQRFKELLIELKKCKGTNADIGQQLFSLFKEANFESVQIQVVKPDFLKLEEKHIPSLTLEYLTETLLEENLISRTELQALIFELKSYEKREDTLIRLPSIYQVSGFKC